MASNASSHHQSRLVTTAGLFLSTGGVLVSKPLITLLQRRPDKTTIFLCVHVHAHVFFLNPLTFYLSPLTFTSEAPLSVFINKHLAQAGSFVCLANLLSTAPLLLHVSVAEESVGFAIAASLSVLALIAIFTSAFKKTMISSCRARRGLRPALFALCISTGNKISIDLPSSLISLFAFMLTITLLFVCIYCAQAKYEPGGMIRIENWVISPLCVAVACIVIDWYMKVYMEVTGMGTAVPVEAVQLL